MHFANPAKGIPRHFILSQDFSTVKTPVGGTAHARMHARRDRTCFSGEARLGFQFSTAAVGGCKLGAKSADAGLHVGIESIDDDHACLARCIWPYVRGRAPFIQNPTPQMRLVSM